MALVKGERFGMVYLPSASEPQKWDTLQTATFSNVDLFWYSLDGDIHPKFEKFRDQPFHFAFNLQCTDKNGASVVYKGKLLSPHALGEKQGELDIANLDEAIENTRELAIKLKLIKDRDDPRANILKDGKMEAFGMLVAPGRKLSNMKLLQYTTAFILADDILDNAADALRSLNLGIEESDSALVSNLLHGGKLTYKQLSRLTLELMSEPLRGNSVGLQQLITVVASTIDVKTQLGFRGMKELHAYFDSALEGLLGIRDQALKLAGGSEEKVKPFFQAIMNWLESASFDGSMEIKEKRDKEIKKAPNDPNKDVWTEIEGDLHVFTVGANMLLETMALEQGVFVEDKIRNSFLFRQLLEHFSDNFSKVNHIMSYQKEVDSEDARSNEVYLLQADQGLSLDKALEIVTEKANRSLRKLLGIGELLVKIHGAQVNQNEDDHGDVEDDTDNNENESGSSENGILGFVRIAKDILCGHIQWCGYTDRYHTNIAFDCYVGE